MRLLRKLMPMLGVALAVLTMAPQTAYAETGAGVAVVVGNGTISPGLTTNPAFQNPVTFNGTVVGLFVTLPGGNNADIGLGVLNCTFNGASEIAETDAQGQGHGAVTCNSVAAAGANTHAPTDVTPAVNITCTTFHYDRVGPVVVTHDHTATPDGNHCNVTICFDHGCTTATVQVYGVFVFVPTSVQPVTTYQLVGVAVAIPWV